MLNVIDIINNMNKKKRYSVMNIPEQLKKETKIKAIREDKTFNQAVIEGLRLWLKTKKGEL